MTDYLGLIIFIFCSLLNLSFAFFEKEDLRKKTKSFVVLSLIVYLGFLGVTSIFVYFALIMGLLGDVLMLRKNEKKYVVSGLIAFGFNHLFYMMAMSEAMNLFENYLCFIVLGVVVVIISLSEFFALKVLKHHQKEAGIYIGLLLSEVMFTILFVCDKAPVGYNLCFLPLIGIILFCMSDAYIYKTLFIKHDKREDFYIMLLYILGQALLSVGIGLI